MPQSADVNKGCFRPLNSSARSFYFLHNVARTRPQSLQTSTTVPLHAGLS